jgi:hypothetical protein
MLICPHCGAYHIQDTLKRCPDCGKELQEYGPEKKKQDSGKTSDNKLAVTSCIMGFLLIPYNILVGGFVFFMAFADLWEAPVVYFCLISIAYSFIGIIIGLIGVYQISRGVGTVLSLWAAGFGIWINSMIILWFIDVFGNDIQEYFGFTLGRKVMIQTIVDTLVRDWPAILIIFLLPIFVLILLYLSPIGMLVNIKIFQILIDGFRKRFRKK